MKMTCLHCCNIFQEQDKCPVCGRTELRPIIVHLQKSTETIVIPIQLH
ncbi:hypothetical protein [Brevibacillus daliensis]|nr:hypothetical protein [Brevibacillus daliensis]